MGESENEGGEPARQPFHAINQANMASTFTDGPAPRSNVQSREASRGLAAEENNVSSRTTTKSSSRLASPVPSAAGRTPALEESAQSEPMTRLPSTSSQRSSRDANATASGYGTRSRNRPGASRPNYAEDVEMDFELANQAQVPQDHDMSSIDGDSHSPSALDSRQSPALQPAKRTPTATNGWNALNKDGSIPGTSTFSANPNANVPSRKRKAATVATQNITGTNSLAPSTTSAGGRRGGTSTPVTHAVRETNMVTFEKCSSTLDKNGNLVSDNGIVFSPNNHVYLICEPPGDPYYIGRIMEFRCRVPDDPTSTVEYVRINWVYRPRDVQRFVNDTRLVYVTMHSDLCPLTSLRGKCQVLHRSEIGDIDQFRKTQDAFWFNQCFDRFIHRWYEVIPASQVINVPIKVKKALDERWKYIVLETSRVKELTSAVKSCTRCSGYCAADDSVDCALCKKTYHLNCVRPPLLKKPSRGFAWACAVCSRDQERKLEARRTPIVGETATDADEDEVVEEEEEDPTAGTDTAEGTPVELDEDAPAPEAEIAHAKMWPMRYLGIHCRVEDVLQYEDRAIYPRASSRLGPKHQANVLPWYGQPIQLVKPVEIKKKYVKSGASKKETKLSKETQLALEADRAAKAKRPKYIQDEPQGYVHRGEDLPNDDQNCTALLAFKMPPMGVHSSRGEDDDAVTPPEQVVEEYMDRAREVAKDIGVKHYSTDFLDRAVYLLQHNSFDSDAAIRQLKKTKAVGEWPRCWWGWAVRKDLRDPRLTLKEDEKRRFDDAVKRYGSELRLVRQHVRTVSHADIVRYWYYWKKTPKGIQIWGSYESRKNASKKKASATEASTKLLDDVADDHDDSAFDNDKVRDRNRKMTCKFCNTKKSRFWRRAPNVTPGQTAPADGRSRDKGTAYMLALCQRCARLWRKYAIQWEDQDETTKKISQGGGRAWKRRVDEELIREWQVAQDASNDDSPDYYDSQTPAQAATEPPKKKLKGSADTNGSGVTADAASKKKVVAPPPPPPPPKEPTPPLVIAMPKMRTLPCAICDTLDTTSDSLLTCRDCKLTVHRNCYGVIDSRNANKWTCDPCANDRKEIAALSSSADPAAYRYECVLCPIKITDQPLVEAPKVSHKKKTDREREKERLEKDRAEQMAEDHRKQQKERGKPELPREPLKRTADNKWVHVSCALWTPEIKFSNAKSLDVAEGIPLIPRARREQTCKLCKTTNGACVSCHHCHAPFHVACAYQHGYSFGFDVTPVKSSRRDGVNIVTLGQETGTLTAAIWCREHGSAIKTIMHTLNESVDESGKIALQLFAENYKQADLTLTGTARKANYLDEITKSNAPAPPVISGNRRVSTAASTAGGRTARNSSAGLPQQNDVRESDTRLSTPQREKPERRCVVCNIDVSPKWWEHDATSAPIAPPVRRISVQADGPVLNGVKPEVLPSRESPMQIDPRPLSNGHAIHVVDGPAAPPTRAADSNKRIEPVPITYECNKCHWRRINAPEELQKPVQEPERTRSHELTTSPPRRPPPVQLWSSMSTLPPQQQLPGWQPYTNGPLHSPQAAVQLPHHPGYPPPIPPPQPPSYVIGAPPPVMPTRSPYATAAPPPPLHTIVSGMPNGLPSPHVPIRSPTHPSIPGVHRQSDSPLTGPPPPQPGAFAYHHGSPAPPVPAPRPSTPRDAPPLPSTPRIVHGASASPNVRNILND